MNKLPEFAQFIISQALNEHRKGKDIRKIKKDLEGTALSVDKKYLEIAYDLLDKREKTN